MTRHLTILTGASRGLGLAMAEQLLDAGHDLVCISRRHNDTLGLRAAAKGSRCEQWPQDLTRPDAAAMRLEAWLAAHPDPTPGSVTLINNAGLVPHIAPLSGIPAQELADAMRVNLE